MKQLCLLIFTCYFSAGFAQDTLKVISLDLFLSHVKENHPVAIVASNDVVQAEAVIRMSKGAFDPVLMGAIDQKYYNGTTYYSTISSGVKFPTRLGIDFKVMGDWNRGSYLNPESVVPADGLTYLGVEVPLGRGMFTDERRTQLRRAEVAFRQSSTERQLTLNELLFQAGQEFINWQEQEAQLALAREGVSLSRLRLQQVRINAELGDRPAIDTVEASAQFYNRQIELEQRLLNVANARLSVENFMWEQGTVPLQLESYVTPEALSPKAPPVLLNDSIGLHPYLSWYELKLADLSLERRLKIEQIKPQLTFNYNLLQTPDNLVSANLAFTNYKWGATLYIPVLLRKERASLEITRLKIASTQLEFRQKERELIMKQLQVRNEWSTHFSQAESGLVAAQRYLRLTEAERSLFELGESSLFLINAREMSYLSAQSKYFEYAAKTQKSALKARYAAGQLGM